MIFFFRDSYIVKIFDRNIDLAQYDDSVSLYTMLREWMRNRPASLYSLPTTPTSNHENEVELRSTTEVNHNEVLIYII